MSEEKQKKQEELDPDELEQQEGEELPDREVMSIIDVGDGGLAPPPVFDPDPAEVIDE